MRSDAKVTVEYVKVPNAEARQKVAYRTMCQIALRIIEQRKKQTAG